MSNQEQLTAEKKSIRWNDGAAMHKCVGDRIHVDVFIVWTKCGRDVPANAAHFGRDTITCERCANAK